ncbi:MAG: prephenate dehydratase [Acidobacteriota bacterium]
MDKNKKIVGIQGEIGSFSEEAALDLLGQDTLIRNFRSFEAVFEAFKTKKINYCVIPMENSLLGSIHRNYDLLLKNKARIQGEIYLRIRHNLIVMPGTKFKDIRTVISHPVALDQCEKFFEKFPEIKIETSYDTSGSVKDLVDSNRGDMAAIAGKRACEAFGGELLMESIQDYEENYTRFVLLGENFVYTPAADKTSVLFSFQNKPRELFKSLSVFALSDIDLTRIESRPIAERPWEYLFYIDFLGNLDDIRVKNALNHLQEITDFFEVIGCYKRDHTIKKMGM